MANKQYNPGQIVGFSKKALVYDTKTNDSFKVEEGTKGTVVKDSDSGEIGAIWIQLEKESGEKVIVKTDDDNITAN